ncbi:MAG: hypothetical protein HN337_09780, partial [Deltaproteobacteria bacterium]|nr:hypothetical protein [Deltaproteobacteria bacterium]
VVDGKSAGVAKVVVMSEGNLKAFERIFLKAQDVLQVELELFVKSIDEDDGKRSEILQKQASEITATLNKFHQKFYSILAYREGINMMMVHLKRKGKI